MAVAACVAAPTTPAPVTVSFAVTFDYKCYYAEDELWMIESRLRSARTLEGAIRIRLGDVQISVVDELAPQVQNLCLNAVPALVAGQPLHVLYYNCEGHLDLHPQADDSVILSGNCIEPTSITLPRLELARALFACSERFFAFAKHIRADDQAYMANLEYMRQYEERAIAALQGIVTNTTADNSHAQSASY